jgi:streptogramin lyase
MALMMAIAPPASAVKITEFPTGLTETRYITAGPDGNLWFTGEGCPPRAYAGCIGRITPTGVVTIFSKGILGFPEDITTGPGGDLWFTAGGLGNYPEAGSTIGRITAAGVVTEFAECLLGSVVECVQGCCFQTPGFERQHPPLRITTGAEGNLWFTEGSGARGPAEPRLGRLTREGVVTNFSVRGGARALGGITLGQEGDLWFAEGVVEQLGRMSPEGVETDFPLPSGSGAEGIATGPEGNLWFTDPPSELPPWRIGRITPTGTVAEFSIRGGITSRPFEITAGPDGNLWFTETSGDRIGRITPRGTITEFSQGISPGAQPFAITAGPGDTVWFTEASGDIGRASDIGHVKNPRSR